MTTNAYPPATPSRSRGIDSYYSGVARPGENGVAAHVRQMIREGRVVAQGEKMRWEENREFFRGNQWIRVANDQRSITALNRNAIVPSGRPGHNSFNRYRSCINARVSLMTKERPPYEVVPEDNDSDSIDAAKQAEKFIGARWGREGWNIKGAVAELAKNGDIDGLAWASVAWDSNAGKPQNQMVAVRMDGTPIQTREEFEALKAIDPEMQTAWRMVPAKRPIGDVSVRVVLPNAMSVDPFAVKTFDNARWCAESRVLPTAEVERRMGKSFKQMVAESTGREASSVQYEDFAVDGGGQASERSGVVVHYFYAKPGPDWPRGVFIEMMDRGSVVLTATEWQDDLPYFPYTPSPDPGHFVRSHGAGDDLKPLQRAANNLLRWIDMWMFKVAHAPVGIPVGSLRSKSFYNEDGYYEYHAAQGEPRQTAVGAEPSTILNSYVNWVFGEMDRLSGVSPLSQGFSMPNGPEATSGIQMQLQQTEQNLSETEHNLVSATEWICNRAFQLVRRHYTVPRSVTGVGVDDAEQFKAFHGALLRGGRFKVVGPLMPKSKAARMQNLMQLAPVFGGERLAPYAAKFLDGDTEDFLRDTEQAAQKQKGEIRALNALVTDPKSQAVWENFQADRAHFAEAFNAAAQIAQTLPPDPMTGQPADPMSVLGHEGITPPNLTRKMQEAGFKLPVVNPKHDDHIAELGACKAYYNSDAFRGSPEFAQQLVIDHMDAHVDGMRQNVQAMAEQSPMGQQSGSAPNPKGTPSPPKQNAPTGG